MMQVLRKLGAEDSGFRSESDRICTGRGPDRAWCGGRDKNPLGGLEECLEHHRHHAQQRVACPAPNLHSSLSPQILLVLGLHHASVSRQRQLGLIELKLRRDQPALCILQRGLRLDHGQIIIYPSGEPIACIR